MRPTSSSKDLISSLPDEILCQILSSLHMEPAVQTSVLSRRWRHIWKYNPVLTFLYLPYDPISPAEYAFIDRCIDLYRASKLAKFLVYGRIDEASIPPIEKWVDFAVSRCVQVLELVFAAFGFFELPLSIYGADSIEVLHLRHVNFSPPLSFNGFRLVKDLTLNSSKVSEEVICKLVANCPLLQRLTIDSCSGPEKVKFVTRNMNLNSICFSWNDDEDKNGLELDLVVDVPNLEYFKYSGILVPMRLNNYVCFVEITSIYGYGYIQDENAKYEKVLINELADVTTLKVDFWFPQVMANEYCENGWKCRPFKNLEVFCWYGYLMSKMEVTSLVAFLGDCPSLQKIELDFHGVEHLYMESGDEDWEMRVGSLRQVKTIDVSYYAGHKCEMELLKLLLQKAVVLDTLFVTFRDPGFGRKPNESEVKFLEEQVSLLHRTASQSKVLFGNAW